jgi:hypothetical protein
MNSIDNQIVPSLRLGGAATEVPQTALEVRQHVNRIQEVMTAVFKEGVHYGRIPGAGDKPVLFKPGAEVLAMTFRIAPEFRIDDLSDRDEIRYRVVCTGRHQGTGIALGEGMGEASTSEEKYRWRSAVCDEEFEATDLDRRRVAFKKGKGGNGYYTVKQVRTNPADLANTVLKMAAKRAQVAMTLNVTGASDCFTQDIEDLPEELRGADDAAPVAAPRRAKPRTAAPASSQDAPKPAADSPATASQIGLIRKKLDSAGIGEAAFLDAFQVETFDQLPFSRVNDALAWITANAP